MAVTRPSSRNRQEFELSKDVESLLSVAVSQAGDKIASLLQMRCAVRPYDDGNRPTLRQVRKAWR